jgi:ankyrin repeat protein
MNPIPRNARSGLAPDLALKAHTESLSIEGELFEAARNGDVDRLIALLDAHPDTLLARDTPYGWTLLHAAAHEGRLAAVDGLLARGLDVNAREEGDDTYAMHWAAAAGHLDVVRRLADAGGDVVGHGDDHELDVIGWATCWDGCDDAAHRAVADFLVSRGARHHIFSAIALNLADEVRRLVAAKSAALNERMSRNENNQTPLHFAVRMNRPQMISVLLALGADPLAVDGVGQPVAAYATAPNVDRPVMDAIRAMTKAEIASADRGHRPSRGGPMDLVAKRDDVRAVKWLLDHGADPNARWGYASAEGTALHMAVWAGCAEVVRLLLDAGADPLVRDREHDADATGWAEYFGRSEIHEILTAHAAKS